MQSTGKFTWGFRKQHQGKLFNTAQAHLFLFWYAICISTDQDESKVGKNTFSHISSQCEKQNLQISPLDDNDMQTKG